MDPEGNLLDEDYIERYITFKGGAVHGRDTYYGRHHAEERLYRAMAA